MHAWTTRESVRRLAEELRQRQPCRLVVHLEDNEQQLLAHALGRSPAEIEALPAAALDALVPPDLSHPRRSREFLAGADGVTLITARLRELAPAAARCLTLWPAADARYFYPRPTPGEFRRTLGFGPDMTVLFYHGNVHAANAVEVGELYTAVARLNEEGTPTTLIRAGLDTVAFPGAEAARAHVLALGQILHHHHLPPLMALADIFVQPGVPDAFNDYRFPSKLPEFFALGRPVVLPRTNLGERVRHGVDAYVLARADADGIVSAVRALRADSALAARLATGAARFAEENFSWRRSAEALAKFYLALAPS
ncbi:glycosyltransferase [Oleiharenicola sp. Vm1]|uniref:glycosyltransferase n=1 Tax=Oleiharenicola sp. Vm1 TaxID=3398393 RepID=UPI0039F57DEE